MSLANLKKALQEQGRTPGMAGYSKVEARDVVAVGAKLLGMTQDELLDLATQTRVPSENIGAVIRAAKAKLPPDSPFQIVGALAGGAAAIVAEKPVEWEAPIIVSQTTDHLFQLIALAESSEE